MGCAIRNAALLRHKLLYMVIAGLYTVYVCSGTTGDDDVEKRH